MYSICPQLQSSHHLLSVRLSRTLINRRQFLRKNKKIAAYTKRKQPVADADKVHHHMHQEETSRFIYICAYVNTYILGHPLLLYSSEDVEEDTLDLGDHEYMPGDADVTCPFKPGYVAIYVYMYVYIYIYIHIIATQ